MNTSFNAVSQPVQFGRIVVDRNAMEDAFGPQQSGRIMEQVDTFGSGLVSHLEAMGVDIYLKPGRNWVDVSLKQGDKTVASASSESINARTFSVGNAINQAGNNWLDNTLEPALRKISTSLGRSNIFKQNF